MTLRGGANIDDATHPGMTRNMLARVRFTPDGAGLQVHCEDAGGKPQVFGSGTNEMAREKQLNNG